MRRRFVLPLLLLPLLASGDIYMHNPRGSNNRLHESSATRNNGDRLYDSQNNARGGYNVGDKSSEAHAQGEDLTGRRNPDGMTRGSGNTVDPTVTFTGSSNSIQYPMVYLEGSEMSLEWTAQHGCGGNERDDPHRQNCNLLIQYMCDTDASVTDPGMAVLLRDGSSTSTPQQPNVNGDTDALWAEIERVKALNDRDVTNEATNEYRVRGRHESEAYYAECAVRRRNEGLFTADQRLRGSTARYTRQNPNGNRRGLECAEERDYYPYWVPTPWRDIAYLTDNVTYCESHIAPFSQNVISKHKCADPSPGRFSKNIVQHTSQAACELAQGEWRAFRHDLPAPVCAQAEWTRENHLGNGRHGQPAMFNWTLPSWTDLMASKVRAYTSASGSLARCVVRLRYNISTDDYDPWCTDQYWNENNNRATESPVQNDPTIDIGVDFIDFGNQKKNPPPYGLLLAVDTTQFGRTFQDRSHVFYIRRKSAAVDALTTPPVNASTPRIHNLNVRGKRGNIVQTYPSVEYDFVPNRLHVKAGDLIHIQWTGSNTHNNQGGGDGQGGDAGEGRGGTDRHNWVQIKDLLDNYPLPLDRPGTIWDDVDCFTMDGAPLSTIDCQIRLTTSGHFESYNEAVQQHTTRPLDPVLDSAPASFKQGVLLRFKEAAAGTHVHYMCTRNNSFSNRSQKGTIIVDAE